MAKTTEAIDQWLQLAIKWTTVESNGPLISRDIITRLSSMAEFLQQLYAELTTQTSVKDILLSFPNIGKLLGRLCSIDILFVHKGVYTSILKCLLIFCKSQGYSALEQKAKQWALTQIRNTVSYTKSDIAPIVAMDTGNLVSDFSSIHLKQICEQIKKNLSIPLKQWDVPCNCYVLVPVQPTHNIEQYCLIGLLLVYISEFYDVLEAIIWWCGKIGDGHKDEISQFYQDLHEICKSGAVTPSYSVQTALWHNYLPSLEEAVIIAVEKCTMYEDGDTMSCVATEINSSFLVRACSEFQQLYSTVSHILSGILYDCKADDQVVNFSDVFHCLVSSASITR